MKLYNTETQVKEEFTPADDNIVRIYACGPTIYNYAHIGNFRTYVFGDLLRRTLKFFGYRILQAMNITDVEDKIIQRVAAEKTSLKAFTDKYRNAFFEDLKTLHIEPAEFYPDATACIADMIVIIEGLLQTGVAYKGADGSIYFSIDQFPSYGRLSHLHLGELKAGASKRALSDEYDKENVADFVLWKAYDAERDGEIFWESPFGPGRPGWHIECSAMAMKLLGPTIDIHVGGVDLIFPHHENEIAQSEGFTKQRFVRYWLHVHHLLVDQKKMSKSLGNFYTLRDLLEKGYTGPQIRYLLIQVHYRTQLNFTLAGLDAAAKSLARISDLIQRLSSLEGGQESQEEAPILEESSRAFSEALADDLNISKALAAVFDCIRHINALCDAQKIGKKGAHRVLSLFKEWDLVLGCLPFERETLSSELQQLLDRRERARQAKNWAEADACRQELLTRGYLIEDTPSGARLKKKPV
jgi:cysteinyl-tRNA synthetase